MNFNPVASLTPNLLAAQCPAKRPSSADASSRPTLELTHRPRRHRRVGCCPFPSLRHVLISLYSWGLERSSQSLDGFPSYTTLAKPTKLPSSAAQAFFGWAPRFSPTYFIHSLQILAPRRASVFPVLQKCLSRSYKCFSPAMDHSLRKSYGNSNVTFVSLQRPP